MCSDKAQLLDDQLFDFLNGLLDQVEASSGVEEPELKAKIAALQSKTRKTSAASSSQMIEIAAPLVVRYGLAEPSGKPAPFGQVTRYDDNLLDKAFMALFVAKWKNSQLTPSSADVETHLQLDERDVHNRMVGTVSFVVSEVVNLDKLCEVQVCGDE